MKRNNALILWGTLFLIAGAFLILGQTGVIADYDRLILPAILLGISLAFHLQYFLSSGRNEGILVPAGILLVYGLLFLATALWDAPMNMLWPLFILGPAVGLFEMYAFSGGRSGSMIPVFILTVIGGSFLLLTCRVVGNFMLVVALLLIGLGAACMINAFVKAPHGAGAKKPEDGDHYNKKADPRPEEPPKETPKE
jgi:hypothetical protein